MIAGGVSSNLNPEKVLDSALQELAQSRTSVISGTREDFRGVEWKAVGELGFFQAYSRAVSWMEGWPVKPFDCQNVSNPTLGIDSILEILDEVGIRNTTIVELAPPQSPLVVIRAIAPGIEVSGDNSYRVGPRLLHAYKNRK